MAFAIYDLAVGAGRLGIAPLPRDRDDVAFICDWGACLVISMTTRQEMAEVGMADLGLTLVQRGLQWDHVAVEDFGEPSGTSQQAWSRAQAHALVVLQGGGHVLIHCKGGCGRSGMAALRVVILAGEAPDVALIRLRHVRPCAVETDAQMAWAQNPSQ